MHQKTQRHVAFPKACLRTGIFPINPACLTEFSGVFGAMANEQVHKFLNRRLIRLPARRRRSSNIERSLSRLVKRVDGGPGLQEHCNSLFAAGARGRVQRSGASTADGIDVGAACDE